jgi:hypothetical protein
MIVLPLANTDVRQTGQTMTAVVMTALTVMKAMRATTPIQPSSAGLFRTQVDSTKKVGKRIAVYRQP